mgnify:CR=1 FL=1
MAAKGETDVALQLSAARSEKKAKGKAPDEKETHESRYDELDQSQEWNTNDHALSPRLHETIEAGRPKTRR